MAALYKASQPQSLSDYVVHSFTELGVMRSQLGNIQKLSIS
jgi:hypothetical protein